MKRVFYIIIIFTVLFLGCKEQEVYDNVNRIVDGPDQESFDAEIILTKEGKPMAKVWTKHLLAYDKRKEIYLQDSVKVDFFDKNGKHNSVLTAGEGVVYNKTGDLTAMHNVVVISDSGVTLLTERLHWINDRQKLISDTTVTFITELDTVWGDYFESDPDLKNYIIKNTRGVSKRKLDVDIP